ncbi:MAG: HAMP domain-containing histidine kinase [Acidobacteria bacterium]|nr:HAMP domain-containing histidine kinase [Acidobacteriota bacterium]
MQRRAAATQVIRSVSGVSSRILEPQPLTGMSRRFGDLLVRPKLMVLHNIFFLVLTCGVYFTVLNLAQERLQKAQTREVTLILNTFSSLSPESDQHELAAYDLRTGSASEFGLRDDARDWMTRFPGRTWQSSPVSEHIFKQVPGSAMFYRLTLPLEFYRGLLQSIRLAVLGVLGCVYILAVLALELIIMPRYVYQPMRLLLDADRATREGDREAEIIDESYIPGDEIGRIMRSHNETVRRLRKREDDLETAKHNLEAQDRLVSLGLLSASVAHEMNTPLAVLQGSIEKLIETTPGEQAQTRLARMSRVTGRLRRISEGLLDFARLRRQETGPVELRSMIDEAWQLVAIDEKAAEVRFTNDVEAGSKVIGNADRLLQVFVNLLRNALLAAPAGDGRIRASSKARVIDGRPGVAVVVEDNGPGIPPEVLPEIFEAFVTTRLDARGTGLGLTVAEGIVSQHGGAISAANCPGGGARLEVVLPVSPQEQTS